MSSSLYYPMVPKGIKKNLAFRKWILLRAAADPKFAAQVWEMCKEDLLFYANVFCWCYNPGAKVKVAPFITYEFQDDAMLQLVDCVENGYDASISKSRDVGATLQGLLVVEWKWHFYSNNSFLLVSRNEDYVDKRGNPKSLFWKIDFLHKHQPRWLLPQGRWLGRKDPNRKQLHLKNEDNNSVIDGESTTSDAGRGDRRTAMFVDEFAAFLLDEGFKVLRASRDTSKCRIFNSTPQGSHNAFYEVCHGTAARQIQLHWSAHPLKNKGLYTTDPKTGRVILLDNYHGEVTLRQRDTTLTRYTFPEGYPFELDQDSPKLRSPWYDNECARCASAQEIAQELDIDFLGSAYPFFDPRFIRIYKAKFGRECLVRGELTYDPETLQPKAFIPHEKGNLQLWINLDAAGCVGKDLKFAAGVDVSAGVGASNSAISITNRATGEKVAVLLTSNIRPHPFAKLAMAVCWLFNEAFLVWDATGATGTTFTKCVVRHGYTNIYYRRNEKKVTREISKEPGYFLNSVARNVLLENYRESLVDGSFVNPSKSGIDECLQFMRRPDGGIEHAKSTNAEDPAGAKSAHGDEVIADALSNVGVSEMKVVAEAEEPAAQPGSLAYRRRQRAASEAETTVDSLPEGW